MMKKIFLSLILTLFVSIFVVGQNKMSLKVYGLELDTLKVMVKKHPRYFEHLKSVWIKTPHKLKEDELMLLYYGSTFLKNYNPVKEDKAIERIAKNMGEFDFGKAIEEGKKLLQIYPLNTRLYQLLGYAYKKTGEKQKSKFYYKKYADLLRIPFYSGTGKNFEQAFIVRTISDEYLILNQKNLELVQQELRYFKEMPFDVLLIKPQSKDNKRMTELPKEKLFFNIYLPFFVGQNKTYKMLQVDAMKKYKIKVKAKK